MRTLHAEPLSRAAFAPFGDVIDTSGDVADAMNSGRFERFVDLAAVDVGTTSPRISIARCRTPVSLPYRIDLLERHPQGTQAFVPLAAAPFFVVVAPVGDTVDVRALRAFRSDGQQGVNYRKGVWHMPMIATEQGTAFLIVDRPGDDNCDEIGLTEPVQLAAAGDA